MTWLPVIWVQRSVNWQAPVVAMVALIGWDVVWSGVRWPSGSEPQAAEWKGQREILIAQNVAEFYPTKEVLAKKYLEVETVTWSMFALKGTPLGSSCFKQLAGTGAMWDLFVKLNWLKCQTT